MLWRFTVFLAFLAIGFCNSTNVLAAKRVALVIGNSNYVNATRLTNPANDATDVAHALDNLGFKVVQGLDLELASMQRAVQDFAERLKGAEVGLLFYSGHGLQVAGINYLVPTNASVRSEADLDFQLLRLDLILKQMEREAKTNIVILDACRNNPLSRNLARNMGTRSTRVGDGLAQIQVGTGTFIAYATQPGNVALDGMAGSRNSPFTAALLQNIPRPRDEIAQLMRKVRRNVMEVTGGEQVPWDSSSLVEDFYFASVSSQQPKPSDISLQSTASIKQEAIKQGEKKTSIWDHNGSSMYLVASGDRRIFHYKLPRPGMADQGVTPNTMLFDGKISGTTYAGTAFLFSKRCGPRSYTVSGPVKGEGRKVTLRGLATQIDQNCQITRTIPDEIVFTYLRME